MGTWVKDTGTDFKRVPPAIFGLIWASERIMTVMSHREPFLKESLSESTATLQRTRRCCCGLKPRPSPHRLCVCTFAPARGMLWEGSRDQDILPSWQTLGTKGGEGRLNPALSSDQSLCFMVRLLCKKPHTRADVTKMLLLSCFTMTDRSPRAVSWNKSCPLTPSICQVFSRCMSERQTPVKNHTKTDKIGETPSHSKENLTQILTRGQLWEANEGDIIV